MNPARRFNPWKWLPVLVIGAAAIPNIVLIAIARTAHISKVEEQPWLAAGRIDHDKAMARAFADGGGSLAISAQGLLIRATVSHASASAAALRCYRPSDARQDRRVEWKDPGAPLELEMPADGAWRIGLELDGVVVATHALNLSR